MNDCCAPPTPINDLDHHFGTERAQEDAADYLENGLVERGEKMLAYLDLKGISVESVLDIGCGAGALHHEILLRNIADRAIGLDASSAFLAAAEDNSQELGLGDRSEYLEGDFAVNPSVVGEAEAVLMDRVLCCYPNMQGLMEPAAEKARRYLIVSYPRDSFWVRTYYWFRGLMKILQRSPFRLYYHEAQAIRSAAFAAGFELADEAIEDVWQIDVYRRVSD